MNSPSHPTEKTKEEKEEAHRAISYEASFLLPEDEIINWIDFEKIVKEGFVRRSLRDPNIPVPEIPLPTYVYMAMARTLTSVEETLPSGAQGNQDPPAPIEDNLTDLPREDVTKTQYVSHVRVMLTYNKRISEAVLEEKIKMISEGKTDVLKIKEIFIARDENSTHVLVIWNRTFRCTSVRTFDCGDCRPIIRFMKTNHDLLRVRKFMERKNARWKHDETDVKPTPPTISK